MPLRSVTTGVDARFEKMHWRAREQGVSPRLYAFMRALLTGPMRVWFRLRVSGAEHVPAEGAAILTPNHKSFLDTFFLGVAVPRHVRFMAKVELMNGPAGWLFARLGAFPVRRGEADAEALETARTILDQGGLLVMFPEGTRVEDAHALGSPHHGAGRLALETGAPVVPTSIAGTQKLWLGPLPKPRRVQVTFLPAIHPRELGDRPDAVSEIVDGLVWPAVQREYGRQLARPGLILGGLAAIGVGAGLVARRQAGSEPRLLGVLEPRKLRRRRSRQERIQRLTRWARREKKPRGRWRRRR